MTRTSTRLLAAGGAVVHRTSAEHATALHAAGNAALAADERHRSALAAFESARAEQKSFGKQVAQAKGEEKQALLAEVKDLAANVKSASASADEVIDSRRTIVVNTL